MASRYQIIECPYKQAEYRKVGLLYSSWVGERAWVKCLQPVSANVQKEMTQLGYTYAILVEEDDACD